MEAQHTPDILVVDDTPANLRVLSQTLKQCQYRVRPVPSGPLALQAAKARPPDLILLDVTMPGMDGYEVCRQLKADPELASIPIIFISAMADTMDKVTAFRVGGVDYITKPFQLEEVEVRVRTHLQLQQARRQLESLNANLEGQVGHRTRELEEANARLKLLDAAKDEFLQLIAHELRTPLNGILGITNLLLDHHQNDPHIRELKPVFANAEARLLEVLNDAMMLSELEVRPEGIAKSRIRVDELLASLPLEAWRREGWEHVTPNFAVTADITCLRRALEALIDACQRLSPRGACAIRVVPPEHGLELHLMSEGAQLSPQNLHKLFEVFAISQIHVSGLNLGLGPALAKRILALFGGRVEGRQCDQGITFKVDLPGQVSASSQPSTHEELPSSPDTHG